MVEKSSKTNCRNSIKLGRAIPMKKPILKNHCLTVKIRLKKKYSLLKQLSNLTKTRLKISVNFNRSFWH